MLKTKSGSIFADTIGQKSFLFSVLFALFFWLVTIVWPSTSSAAIYQTIHFQGKLVNTNGTNIADGTYNMQFKLYTGGDGVVGGGDESLQWTEERLRNNSQGVSVTDGIFQINLGSVTALPDIFNNNTIWLSMNLGNTNATCTPFSNCAGDGEMSPMIRMTSAPYALNSDKLQGLQATNFVQLAQGLQADGSTTNPSIYINKTGGTANLLQLQRGGSDVFVIDTNGLSTFYDDVDLSLAATENLTLASTTGSNAVDLVSLALTNNDAGSAAQRGIVLTNADSTSITEALLALDNADITASSLTDGIIITSSGVSGGVVDAIDASADNITNAINVGANTLTGAGYLITSTASGLTVNSTSANLTLQTTTSGDINITPAGGITATLPSGTTDFTISGLDGDSNLILTGMAGNNAILYADTSGVVKTATSSTGSQCLLSGAAAAYTPSWGSCSGGSTTLQNAYDTGAAGDQVIALDATQDSVIIRNPASAGSDSTYILTVDQLNTSGTGCGGGVCGGLSIQSAGTGNLLLVTDTTATARDVLTIADTGLTTFRTQTDSATGFQILDADGGTPVFNVDTANERVGVGTATPLSTFQSAGVVTIGNPTAITGAPSGIGSANLFFESQDNFAGGLNVAKRGDGTAATNSIASGAELGYHGFYGWDGSTFARGAYALVSATEAWTGTAHGSRYRIAVTPDGSTTNAIQFVINQDGNSSFGFDNTPDAKLELINDGSGDSFLVADSTDGDSTPFVIDSAGKVGIGDASPDASLDIDFGTTVPTVDLVAINDSASTGTTTTGVDGLQIDFKTGNGTNPTNNGLNIALTSGGLDVGDILNGINLSLSGTAGTERGINIGSGFDTALNLTQAAASQALVIDATTTDNTTTAGVIDLNVDSATDNNIGLNIDYTSINSANVTNTAARINNTINSDATFSTTGYGLYINQAVNDATSTGTGLYVDAGTGAGTEYAGVFMNGNVGIGDSSPLTKIEADTSTFATFTAIDGVTASAGYKFSMTQTDSAFQHPQRGLVIESTADLSSNPGSAKNILGYHSSVYVPTTNSTTLTNLTLRGGNNVAGHRGTGGLSGLQGMVAAIQNSNTATVTNAEVLRTEIVNSNASGVITNLYGLNISNISNSGTITSTYGVYVGDITAGTQTNTPYSFYASDTGAYNLFAGNTRIGSTTAPSNALDITGTGTVSGLFKVGDASGNDYLEFLEEASNPTCGAGLYAIWANSTDTKLKKCENGTVSDLAGGGGTLQQAYDASGTPATITTSSTAKGIVFKAGGGFDGNVFQIQSAASAALFTANTANSVITVAGQAVINATNSSIVRTTTADFALGTVGSSVTNANDQLELSDGTVPNSGKGTIAASALDTFGAVGAGSHSITRSDGKYVMVRGGGTALEVFDSIAGTFTVNATVLGAAAGAGSTSIPRPSSDQYVVIHGGGATSSTLLTVRGATDLPPTPVITAATGPTLTAGPNAGTVLFRRADGRYLVTIGGSATGVTNIYNPITNANMTAGPSAASTTWAAGALALPRPDGQALIVAGGATANTQLYNPNSAAADIGVFAAGPVLPTGCEINNAGSIAVRKSNGTYIVMSKINASAIYDPVANTWSQNGTSCTTPLAGKGPTVALADGAHAIPLQNGKFLIIHGGALTSADIYDPSDDSFTAHGTALTAGGAGRHSIMQQNGIWRTISGGGVQTDTFDTSLPMSDANTRWTSDDISTSSLNATSILRWTAVLEGTYIGRDAATNTAFSSLQFKVRTADDTGGGCTTPLNSASDKELTVSGNLIRPGTTDDCVRLTVQFNRPLPRRLLQERGTWTGNNSTVVRFDYTTPALFDVAVDNATVLRRNSFDFVQPSLSSETSGPLLGGAEISLRAEGTRDRLYLPYGRLTTLTTLGGGATIPSGFYPGVFSAGHPNLPQTTTDGTVVIQRPDKQFIVLSSGAANAALYDPATSTFTAQSGAGNIPTAAIGAGAHAIKRPDGKFLIMVGGASTTTNIYDPNAASGSRFIAGPATTAAVGQGSHSILNNDGTFTILHGGAATSTSIYNPVRNTMIVGPASPVAISCGSFAIPRPKFQQYLVAFGAAEAGTRTTTSSVYDAQSKIFSATAASNTLAVGTGCGSFAFQRPDGFWVVLAGESGGTDGTTGFLYNPDTNISTALGLTFSTLAHGGHVIPRADGTFLLLVGSDTTTTNIYVPWGGAFLAAGAAAGQVIVTSSPATATAIGDGALSFQRPDGKWVTIVGGATASAVTNTYDAGWYPDGQYLSEQVQVPALAAGSTIDWRQSADDFVRMEVRAAASQAALNTTTYQTVGRPGQSINNAGGETWVQVQINFRRDFPTFCGNLDGVYASNGGMAYCYRNISVPTLFEYKISNGKDVLDLRSDGLSVLRVTTAGGIFSSAQGGFYAGGADLAENYTSTQSLKDGEVVVSDPSVVGGVLRSTKQYQSTILGVVSTTPGFVAGAYTEDSHPIALVGRVPVKVTDEGGPIAAGDRLTSSNLPGYAMKATLSGRVLGTAVESLDPETMLACPEDTSRKCGDLTVFVNLTDYTGASAKTLAASYFVNNLANGGLEGSSPPLGLDSSSETQVLDFLKHFKQQSKDSGLLDASEIFTARLSAADSIVTPRLVVDELFANKIKANQIEGLEILVDKISSLPSLVDGQQSTQNTPSNSPENVLPDENASLTEQGKVKIASAKITLDLSVGGALVVNGGLTVDGPAKFGGEVSFIALVKFLSTVSFAEPVSFDSHVLFGQDAGGKAVIKAGKTKVDIKFEKPYNDTPFINASYVFEETKAPDGSVDTIESKHERLMSGGYSYGVGNVTQKGFTIFLNKPASEDITLSWVATAVKDAKVTLSQNP